MPNAKIPMVSVSDIAQFALGVFLDEKNEHTEQRIIGPELLTYDQVNITHFIYGLLFSQK